LSGLVLDASVAMTWCFPDENSPYAERVLDSLQTQGAFVPGLWAIEVANAVLSGERRKRLQEFEAARFFALLNALSITVDPQTAERASTDTLALARRHDLTISAATYLELAIREGLALATLDEALRKAAQASGVPLIA